MRGIRGVRARESGLATVLDIGMAIFVGVFVGLIVLGRNAEYLDTMLVIFLVALVIWAFTAEFIMSRAEAAAAERLRSPEPKTTGQAIPHSRAQSR